MLFSIPLERVILTSHSASVVFTLRGGDKRLFFTLHFECSLCSNEEKSKEKENRIHDGRRNFSTRKKKGRMIIFIVGIICLIVFLMNCMIIMINLTLL